MPDCPQCRLQMQPARVAGLAVETCPSCAGLWLEPSALAALQRRLCQGSTALQRPFLPRPTEPLLSCPACPQGHLQPGTVRSVRAFRCGTCRGVFLPAGLPPNPPAAEQEPGEFQPDVGGALVEFVAQIVGAFL